MKRSIRRTLMVWYALILALVITGFSLALLLHFRALDLLHFDSALRSRAAAVRAAIEWDEVDGFELELSEDYLDVYRLDYSDAPYLVIFGPAGKRLFESPRAPEMAEVPAPGRYDVGSQRHVVERGPGETTIVLGRSTAWTLKLHSNFAGEVFWVAAGVWLVALIGGWFLVRRVLRPIDRITETASRLSASNLSERIDVAGTESELGRLATTLNGAFDRLGDAVEQHARFAAEASHELRTPLAVIAASAEWALRQERAPEAYAEALGSIQRAAGRMDALVEDLLVLARGDVPSATLTLQAVGLERVARETALLLAPLAEQHGITLDIRAEAAPVTGDEERLGALAICLVSNAIRHGESGTRVEVATGSEESSAFLVVSDDGPGIPESDLPKVFDRFYRVDHARSTHNGGTGLGLAIAKSVTEAHGGTIEAASAPGAGATFRVRLPLRR